ncbi:hypothetical protein [Sneathiella glossodoripedis]|uniref:hypothetical protein n=1 Tax=Sneathiella glossodoripedis TaxID=418853 RepID=UPI0004704B7C|nr:hypothetical protein [Sneathiella glossodoripedis]
MRGCRCNISAEDIAQIASTLHRRVERIGSFRQAMLLNDNLEHRSMRLLIASMSDFSVTYRTFLDTEQDLEQKVRAWLGLADDFEFPDFIKP